MGRLMSVHGRGSLNTVMKTMRLKRSSGSALRSTFMRRIAPSQEESRNSARSCGANVVGDLARRLPFRDACGEWRAPFGEDLGEPCPQHLALRRGLEAEIADQAAAGELGLGEAVRDDVEIAPQALAGAKIAIVQRLGDQPLRVVEIEIEHLARELLLRAEVVGERALGALRLGDDVAHPCPD